MRIFTALVVGLLIAFGGCTAPSDDAEHKETGNSGDSSQSDDAEQNKTGNSGDSSQSTSFQPVTESWEGTTTTGVPCQNPYEECCTRYAGDDATHVVSVPDGARNATFLVTWDDPVELTLAFEDQATEGEQSALVVEQGTSPLTVESDVAGIDALVVGITHSPGGCGEETFGLVAGASFAFSVELTWQ